MADGGAVDIFVYLGGDQEVPDGVTHAIIDPSVNSVRMRAFRDRRQLVSVIFHDGVENIEIEAFYNCESLRGVKLSGVWGIGERAFCNCIALSDVEFGDRLETIGMQAFSCCSLRSIKMPSVRRVRAGAFCHCSHLMKVEFGSGFKRFGWLSFYNCPNLQRITIPLKHNLFACMNEGQYDHFALCDNLRTVDIVGVERMHKTISSLLMESWRVEMNDEIDRINRELPSTDSAEKANAIQQWIRSVLDRMEHYKVEHNRLLKEGMTLLELAVWKTKLDEKDDNSIAEGRAKKAKIDTTIIRNEQRITSGADIVIRNVVPFLQLDE